MTTQLPCDQLKYIENLIKQHVQETSYGIGKQYYTELNQLSWDKNTDWSLLYKHQKDENIRLGIAYYGFMSCYNCLTTQSKEHYTNRNIINENGTRVVLLREQTKWMSIDIQAFDKIFKMILK